MQIVSATIAVATPKHLITMRKRFLFLLAWLSSLIVFGQNPQPPRVLSLIPDDCYQLQLINWSELSNDFKLAALDKDKILNPLYKEKKIIKSFVRSWIQMDDKSGIDFSTTAAFINKNCLIVPLSNEKNFEKTVRKVGDVNPFKTISGNAQHLLRFTNDASGSIAILCTQDMACIYLSESEDDDAEKEASIRNLQQTLVHTWDKMQKSTFPTSEVGKFFIQRGMLSYVAYNAQHPDLKMLSGIIKKQNTSLSSNLDKLNVLMFSTGDIDNKRFGSKTELYKSTPNGLEPISMKNLSPEGTVPLLPYVLENPIAVISCNVVGLGDSLAPYLSSHPDFQALAPLLNHPFIGSIHSEKGTLLCTTIDDPKRVKPALEQYVVLRNQALDSVFKASRSKDTASVEVAAEEGSGDDEYDIEEAPYEPSPEDSLVNHKHLALTHTDGYDLYTLTTYKKNLDYETFTWVYGYDTTCFIMTKDNLLFLFGEAEIMQSILNPTKSSPAGIRTQDPLYARVYLNTLFREIGEEDILPLRDMTIQTNDNKIVMDVTATDGLKHSLPYELVKAIMEQVSSFRKATKNFKF